jgi:hypothetical protein
MAVGMAQGMAPISLVGTPFSISPPCGARCTVVYPLPGAAVGTETRQVPLLLHTWRLLRIQRRNFVKSQAPVRTVSSKGNPDEQFHLVKPREYWGPRPLRAIRHPASVSNGGGNLESPQPDIGSHADGSSVVRRIREIQVSGYAKRRTAFYERHQGACASTGISHVTTTEGSFS